MPRPLYGEIVDLLIDVSSFYFFKQLDANGDGFPRDLFINLRIMAAPFAVKP